jgi:hypothetical protein
MKIKEGYRMSLSGETWTDWAVYQLGTTMDEIQEDFLAPTGAGLTPGTIYRRPIHLRKSKTRVLATQDAGWDI